MPRWTKPPWLLPSGCTSADLAADWSFWGTITNRTKLSSLPTIRAIASNCRNSLRSKRMQSSSCSLPDQHLGRNTAYAMGWPLESMALWDPNQANGGLTPQQIRDAHILLWKGHCSVHALFSPEQIDKLRAIDPTIKVIVHPE